MFETKQTRSLWPRAIAAYFIFAILGLAVFIGWAARQNVDLVRKDYYAEELQFQQRLNQIQQTQQLNWKPEISYDPQREVVIVSLLHQAAVVAGNVQFYRPSDARLDKNVTLILDVQGTQQIDAHKLQPGLWKVRVTWRSDAKEFFSEETIVINRS